MLFNLYKCILCKRFCKLNIYTDCLKEQSNMYILKTINYS